MTTESSTKTAAERASLEKLAAFEDEAFALLEDEEEEPAPIGVPRGFTGPKSPTANPAVAAALESAGISTGSAPRFHDGDEWVPASLPAARIADLQAALAAAGVLKSKYRKGYWEGSSVEAYRNLLGFANAAGISDERHALTAWSQAEEVDATAAAKALPFRPPDPAAVRLTVRDAGRKLLGRELRDNETEILALQLSALMQQEHNADQQAAVAEAAGTPTAAPQVDAEAQFRELMETRYKPQIKLRTEQVETAGDRQFVGKSLRSISSMIGGGAPQEVELP